LVKEEREKTKTIMDGSIRTYHELPKIVDEKRRKRNTGFKSRKSPYEKEERKKRKLY